MSSLYRRNGIYWLSFRLHGKSYCISLRTRDRSAAIYKKADKDKELIEGRAEIPRKDSPCLPALEEHIKFNQHRRTYGTNLNAETRIKHFLSWAKISELRQINEEIFQRYLNHRLNAEGVSKYEANNTIRAMKTWLTWCVKMHKIFGNPLKDVKIYGTPESTRRFLSKDEIKTLLGSARKRILYADSEATLYPILATAIYTGMRRCELFNLQWQDIDFQRGVVTVRNREGFLTKSRKNRQIPLHKALRHALSPIRRESSVCFDKTNFRRIFARITKDAKMPDLKLHEIRHTFITWALMSGVPVPTVQEWAGHADIKTTMIYYHLCKKHSQEEINKLDF